LIFVDEGKILEADHSKDLLFVETITVEDFKTMEDHQIEEDRQFEEFRPFVECHSQIKEVSRTVDIHR
jgi:hypothetical protein